MADLITGGDSRDNPVANWLFGSPTLGLANDIFGNGGAGDALVSSGAAMAMGAGKNVVTYGRRTSTLTSLNLSGKGGLPEALSRGTWGKVLKVLPNTIALDPGFWPGDALSCLVSR